MNPDKLQYMEVGNSFFLSYKSYPKINMSLCTRYEYSETSEIGKKVRPVIDFAFDNGNCAWWIFDTEEERSIIGKELGLED